MGQCVWKGAMLRWSDQLLLVAENHHFEGSTHLRRYKCIILYRGGGIVIRIVRVPTCSNKSNCIHLASQKMSTHCQLQPKNTFANARSCDGDIKNIFEHYRTPPHHEVTLVTTKVQSRKSKEVISKLSKIPVCIEWPGSLRNVSLALADFGVCLTLHNYSFASF